MAKEEILKDYGISEHFDLFGKQSFRPTHKIAFTAPKIISEYHTEEVDKESGESILTRMYECEPFPGKKRSRIFIADVYDRNFKPNHGKKLLPGRSKGEQSNYKIK